MKKRIEINRDELLDCIKKGYTHIEISKHFNCGVRTVQSRITELKLENEEIVEESVRLAKKSQKLQDVQRIERKTFREQARIENAVSEYASELKRIFTNYKLPEFATIKKIKTKKKVKVTGVVHITDTHFNELVDLGHNKYDFKIASKRIQKLIDKSKNYFKSNNVDNILVAFTGDLLNSDRRLDELLSQSTNRAKASFLAVSILKNAILDLAKEFNVTVVSVVGNESRITKDVGWAEDVASDNYDFIIYNILKLLFEKSNVRFLTGDSVEKIIEISGQNVLILHGNSLKATKMEKSIQGVKGKWSAKGIKIDFVLSGHLHSARISDGFARGASLPGANAYSDSGLQLDSRASQNIHLFYSDESRDSIKIDLQTYDGYKGYPIQKELEAYNAKSLSKAKKKVTIHKVVI